ncbi:MAG: mechanosensitive ion channel family protein [Oligoflexia bacterium]|nr:mechanosensitive ion channel family protein [Oligoflexia bacterium]
MQCLNAHFYRSNTYLDLLISVGIFLLSLVIFIAIKRILLSRLKKYAVKTPTKIDDELVTIFDKYLMPIILMGVFYFSFARIDLSELTTKWIDRVSILLITFIATKALIRGIVFSILTSIAKKSEHLEHEVQYSGFMALLKTIIWSLSIIFILDNLGFKISTMVAGLGIGGIAIALAAQAFLGDLFNYFVIIFDEPFKVGDFIIFGEHMGKVESVGIKTSRVRCLGGEQIIVSNTSLMSCEIRNFQKMEERRIVFTLGVVYETTHENLEIIPSLIQNVISEQHPKIRFDRCNFAKFGDFSLIFETVYYVLSGDYNEYMRINELINLGIHKEFSSRCIVFAFPTTTIHLAK